MHCHEHIENADCLDTSLTLVIKKIMAFADVKENSDFKVYIFHMCAKTHGTYKP